MTAEVEQRIRTVVHTPEDARRIALINQIRALAAGIMIEAEMGQGTTIHPRIGTPEQRSASTAQAAQQIMNLAQQLSPRTLVLTPRQFNYRTTS